MSRDKTLLPALTLECYERFGFESTVQKMQEVLLSLAREQQQAFAGTTSAYKPLTDETGMGLYLGDIPVADVRLEELRWDRDALWARARRRAVAQAGDTAGPTRGDAASYGAGTRPSIPMRIT